ncbi:MAG: hypothetical protein WCF90_07325 [Methanomicrobiales archaeon]
MHAAVELLIAQLCEEVVDVLLFSPELICEEHKICSDSIMLPEISTLKRITELQEAMVNGARLSGNLMPIKVLQPSNRR